MYNTCVYTFFLLLFVNFIDICLVLILVIAFFTFIKNGPESWPRNIIVHLLYNLQF